MIAIPILSRKKIGIRNESMVNDNTTSDRTTASNTYTGTSLSDRSRISVTTADIPLRKHCSLEMARICSTASIVSSADIVVSYMINISVPSSLRNTFCIFSGSISVGILISATLSYQSTVLTWSTSSIFAFRALTSLFDMPSTTKVENAPVPNSSTRISWPFIVSISSGR